ncbi:MAG TPA: site-specific integrase [Sphingobium sp.]
MSYGWSLGKLTRKRADGTLYWSYCVIYYVASGRVRKTLDTQDRQLAEAKAHVIWSNAPDDLRRDPVMVVGATGADVVPTFDFPPCDVADSVGACVEQYLDSLQGLRDEKRKREAWKAARAFWGDVPVASVDEPVCHAYMKWRGKALNTMRNELSGIRVALKWKYKNDAPKVMVPGIPPSRVGHLTKPQFKKFLDGCGMPHVKLFAILGVTTGGRKSAILQAKWEQVDWTRRQLNLNGFGRVQNSKKRATVPLNAIAMEALEIAKEGATTDYIVEYRCVPLTDIKRGMDAASARSGIKAHPHMFRHSAAVWMAESRVPMSEISSFLGHTDINITSQIYARYHPEFLREAAEALTW